ncbi:sigma-70 family RNA polymerase sigma factor [uncultured Eubacterium sp.]|uniref:sigma-70 family RNA polymerase sigma factor n=1 Tax=uncultured Eubacterium sp. TaxID=165185 RepID=UPI00265D46F5|nr:sigma-70 family RNA polymerase sigma factor [uncultured Eubacterium sp.]
MNNEELAIYLKEHPTDKARLELLYMKNIGFMRKYIKKYFPCEETEDLLQESYFAMLKAIKGYDESKGKFLTYLGWYLRNHLTRYVYSYSGVGVSTNELINKYNRINTELEEQGIIPTIRVMAYKMGVSVQKVQEIEKLRASRVSASTNKEINDGFTLLDAKADKNINVEKQVLDKLQQEQLKKDIWECVERLPREQADIIIKHYKKQQQYKEIAEELQISYKALMQKKDSAFWKMRRDRQTLRKLRPYIEDIRNAALQGNGVGTFKRIGMSSTERVAIKRVEYGNILEEIANF